MATRVRQVEKSGNKVYIFDCAQNRLPKFTDLVKILSEIEDRSALVDSMTLNPRNSNAAFYADLSSETLKIFIYAFAFQLGKLSSESYKDQFQMNARRLNKLCKKKRIILTPMENTILFDCIEFSTFVKQKAKKERQELSTAYMQYLQKQYC